MILFKKKEEIKEVEEVGSYASILAFFFKLSSLSFNE